jgi:protein PET117
MSAASYATLAVTVAGSLGIIWQVHHSQVEDRARLREGIVRDEERQARRRAENLEQLVLQQELEERLRRAEGPRRDG